MGGNLDSRNALYALLVALVLFSLAGCGTAPLRAGREDTPYATHGGQPAKPSKGGYYKDDGPGDNPPDIDRIEDAEPRLEPLHRFANNPYTVENRSYTPMRSIRPFKQRGAASWYGRRFNGQPTSSGEIYDMYAMTGAHPTLPIPSYAKVTNLRNGRSVVVRVNDRGPFHSDRIVDLSYTAAAKLGYADSGSAQVELELIQAEDMPRYARRGQNATALAAAASAAPTSTPPSRAPGSASFSVISSAHAAESAADPASVYLQLGVFSARDNAEALRSRVASEMQWLTDFVEVLQREGRYRVQVGPYKNRGDAASAAERIRAALQLDPVFVSR